MAQQNAPSSTKHASDEGRFVTIAEVKTILEREAKERTELAYELKLALEHARACARLSKPDAEKLVKDLQKIEKVTEWHAFKLADILPTHPDDVRAVFSRDRFTLEKAEIDKILDAVRAYL